MTIHTFIFRCHPHVTDAQKTQLLQSVRALQGQIPGLLAIHTGANVSPRSQGYELGGVMHFANPAALEAYNDHPAHQALLPTIRPLLRDVIEVDFEA